MAQLVEDQADHLWPTNLLLSKAHAAAIACVNCHGIPKTCMNNEDGEIFCNQCAKDLDDAMPSKAVQNLVNKMKTKCLSIMDDDAQNGANDVEGRTEIKDNQCGWIGMIHEWMKHSTECIHILVTCDACSFTCKRKLLAKHVDECLEINIVCPLLCGSSILRKNVETHLENDCMEQLLQCCHDDCNQQIKRKDFKHHVDNECDTRIIIHHLSNKIDQLIQQNTQLSLKLDQLTQKNAEIIHTNQQLIRCVHKNANVTHKNTQMICGVIHNYQQHDELLSIFSSPIREIDDATTNDSMPSPKSQEQNTTRFSFEYNDKIQHIDRQNTYYQRATSMIGRNNNDDSELLQLIDMALTKNLQPIVIASSKNLQKGQKPITWNDFEIDCLKEELEKVNAYERKANVVLTKTQLADVLSHRLFSVTTKHILNNNKIDTFLPAPWRTSGAVNKRLNHIELQNRITANKEKKKATAIETETMKEKKRIHYNFRKRKKRTEEENQYDETDDLEAITVSVNREKANEELEPITGIQAASTRRGNKRLRWEKWEEDFITKEWRNIEKSESNEIYKGRKCIIISHKLAHQTSLVVQQNDGILPKSPWRTSAAVENKLQCLGLFCRKTIKRRKKRTAEENETKEIESDDSLAPSHKKRKLNDS